MSNKTMQPYAALSQRGRLRRVGQLAEAALKEYGLRQASAKFYMQAGHTLYKVRAAEPEPAHADDDLFEPGLYLLRVYKPGWQSSEAIKLELAWLAAMRSEAALPVQEPIPRLDGGLLTQVCTPGVPEGRDCALLRWVKGRLLPGYGRAEHYRAQGRLMGRMHNFASRWQAPSGTGMRQYDWDGLFMNDAEVGLPWGESWQYLPPSWVEPFKRVAAQFRELSEDWGKGPEVYGLVHGDMGLDANVLFRHGQPRLIDFEGAGFGYWMYDLAVALAHLIANPALYDRFREALFEGYCEERSLPEAQSAQLGLFTAAFNVYFALWVAGGTHLHPEYLTEEIEEMMYRGAAFVLRYVGESGSKK